MGVYFINVVCNLFGEELVEVFVCGVCDFELFFNFDDIVSVMLCFVDYCIVQFVVSYSGVSMDQYCIFGIKGDLEVLFGFMFGVGLKYCVIIDGKMYE